MALAFNPVCFLNLVFSDHGKLYFIVLAWLDFFLKNN